MKRIDYELVIVLVSMVVFVLGICIDNTPLFILGFIGLIVSTGGLIKKKSDSDEDADSIFRIFFVIFGYIEKIYYICNR